MNFALQKTLELLVIIFLGVILQKKIGKDQLNGIKTLILTIALPATIFVALLKINVKGSLLIFPLLALAFNLIMLLATKYLSNNTVVSNEESKKRTLMMLMPSLAPGLSCFPFIAIYLGEDSLALAALADVGNKIFVLIILYTLAMHWYRKNALQEKNAARKSKLKSLFISLLNEPINMVIIVAFILLAFGLNLNSLPKFLGNTITSMSVLMTPLVLLFIGLAVRIKLKEFGQILFLLTQRAGIAFCISAILIYFIPSLTPALILLLIVFPQSSCSFWPFAHMSMVSSMEEKDKQPEPTFNINFAVSVMACSLPFSTIIIISVFTFSETFADPNILIGIGSGMVLTSFLPYLYKKIKRYGFSENADNFSVYSNIDNKSQSNNMEN